MELALSVFVCIALYLLRMYFLNRPDKKMIRRMTRERIEVMEKKGYAHLMMQDASFKNPVTDADTDIPSRQKKLQGMLNEMMARLGLMPNVTVSVQMDEKGQMTRDGRAGEYDGGARMIRIFLRKSMDAGHMTSILCHECAHCFMDRGGMNVQDFQTNERNTDITACLMGYSLQMLSGYTGYIKSSEVRMVRKILLEWRSTKQASQGKAQSQGQSGAASGAGQEARKLLSEAKRVLGKNKVPGRVLPSEDYQRLYRISEEIRLGQTEKQLETCLRSGEQGRQTLLKLTDDLRFVIRAMQ
ncbi:MAG: hypothetical protein IJ083_08310 [Clostridia bacterium]|nr:hypothetical protein [Clostridia bacterium]